MLLARPAICRIRPKLLFFDTPPAQTQFMKFVLSIFLIAPIWCSSPSEPITPDNVARLRIAWTYDTGEHTELFRKRPQFEATPVYADGNLYVSTPGGLVAALNADTGREIWKTDLHVSRDRNYSNFANRGVTLAGDTIFVGTADARLVSLDRSTGKLRPGFGEEGQVELTV